MRCWFGVVLTVFVVPLLAKNVPESGDYEDSLPVVRMQETESPRFTQGIPVKPGELPSVVALTIQKPNEDIMCTGTIIRDEYVLTSGSCVKDAKDIVVYIGCVQLDNCTEILHGKGIVHSSYRSADNMFVNDIALVRTTKKMSETPVSTNAPALLDRNCSIVAFINTVEEHGASRRLFKLPIRTMLPCNRLYARSTSNKFYVFCATIELGTAVTFEDSGGPLLCDNVQVGVVSQAVKSSGTEVQSTQVVSWVPVSEYEDWIQTSFSQTVSISPNLILLIASLFYYI